MNLTGGINMYMLTGGKSIGRYENGNSPYGRKVKYLGEGGWKLDKVYAGKQGLIKDNIYTVREIYVGRSSSDVTLLEVDGKFNTVMFEDVDYFGVKLKEVEFVHDLLAEGENEQIK